MSKTKKTLIIISSIVLILVMVVGAFNIYFAVIGKQIQKGETVGYDWSEEDSYDTLKSSKLDMGDGDYKILVLTDIHLKNHGTFAAWLGINYILDGVSDIALDKLVKDTAPDLILVLGDTTLTQRNDIEYKRFVKNMDSYGKPWACVFGNHDDEGRADKAKLAEVLKESEYGLFDFGPKDLHGAGNYVIELLREDKTAYSLFMMDSGSSTEFEGKTDGINNKQLSWYNWNIRAISEKNGATPKNMAFFHIPLKMYSDIDDFEIGDRGENSATQNLSVDFFNAFKKNNGTHILAGHDHNNNFISVIDGVKIGYAMKSSYNCYFKSGMTGGTLLTIDKDNNVREELRYF